jgi:tetratricopeptide (TPR) repeat protein
MRALDIRAADGNVLGQAYLHANMAKAYQDWRQFDRALASVDSGVALADSGGDGHALGYALNTRAGILIQLGRIAEAREAAERSLAAYYSGSPPIEPRDSVSAWSINVMTLGEADLRDGRAADALRRFGEIYDRAQRGGTRRGQAHALLAMARAQEALGRGPDALGSFRRALAEADAIQNRAFRLEALAGLSRVAQRGGDAAAALRFARAHEALRDSLFDARTAQRVAAIELEAEAARQRAAAQAAARQQAEQAAELRQQRMLTMMVGLMLLLTLEKALDEVRTLSGFIPICANCKNVRDDAGYWQSVEEYLASRSVAQFSHSICNSCGPQLYGADWEPHAGPAAAPSAPPRVTGPTPPAAP